MRVGIFVDAANMFYAQRDNGWHIDWRKVKEHFSRGRELVMAAYFTGSPYYEDVERLRRYRKYRTALTLIGYTVIDKELKEVLDRDTGIRKRKANLDVEFTLHVLAAMPAYDVAVLLTGDGDFAPLAEHLCRSGKQVICVARRESAGLELINAATTFVDLNSIRQEIEKT